MRGVSTRNYREVLPEMAETVGVSKSQVSREFIEASEKSLMALMERRFDEKNILIVYLHFRKTWLHHAANGMMRWVSSMILRGNHQTALIINNSFCRTHKRKAFRRLAWEGRRAGSSHGESLRSQSCS